MQQTEDRDQMMSPSPGSSPGPVGSTGQLHVVVGKGPIGSTTAELLAGAGHRVRVLSRSGAPAGSASTGPGHESIEHRAIDVSDLASLTAATSGAEVIYNCANPSGYHRWLEEWPPMATAMLDAAERSGAVLATVSNLYLYGPVARPMTEDLPLSAPGAKGRVRVDMWNQAIERHRQGRIRCVEARGSDYYGPRVLEGGALGERVMPRLLAGKGVRLLGDLDVAHSFTYTSDMAAALVRLGSDERGWGRAWHVPTAPARSQRQMVQGLCEAAGVDPISVGRVPWPVVRALGLVVPVMGELQETRYQFDDTFVVDSSDFTRTFGDEATPLGAGFAHTVDWWRRRV